MKHIYIYLAALLAVCGCSLEEDRESFADREHSYQNMFQAESVVKSVYGPAKLLFNSSSAMMMESATDLWTQNTSIVDATCNISPARSGQASNIWKRCYNGVMRCNECIECINASEHLDKSDALVLQAEARVMRAFFYYYLTNVFNGVPFYTCMVKDMETLEMIRQLPRTDASIIRQTLYEDLKENAIPYFTEENGQKRRTSEVEGNRAGYALGLMLMAKFAMWNQDWSLALEPLTELETLYGTLTESAYPLEETVWWKKNTNESIFEIQHEWQADGIQFTSTVCTNYYPTIEADGTLDGVYMPEWGTELSTHTNVRASYRFGCFRPASGPVMEETTSSAYTSGIFRPLPLTYDTSAEPYNNRYRVKLDMNAIRKGEIKGQKLDRRILYVLGLGNLETGETFDEVQRLGRPFAGRKFWIPNRTANYDSNNYKIFRYADAVQMMAECYCMKGDLQKALEYLNYPRIRAGVEPYRLSEYPDNKSIMQLVRDERARELAGELHRKFDLVRWGIWYDEVVRWTPNESLKSNIRPYHEYYPIPDSECAITGYILNNPAYEGIQDDDTVTETPEE